MIIFPLAAEMPRIFTAIAEWAACVIYILPLKKRLNVMKTIIVLILACFLQGFLQEWAGTLPLFLWIPGTVINIIFMLFVIYFICDLGIKDSVYWCAHAIIAAELVASVEWMIYCLAVYAGIKNSYLNEIIYGIVVYFLMFVAIYFMKKRVISVNTEINVTVREMQMAVIVAVIIYTISNIGFVFDNATSGSNVNSYLIFIRTLVDICGFCILYIQQNQRHEHYLRKELKNINSIFELQYKQYLAYKENSDMINRKCHDLKHQIEIIRLEKDEKKRESYLSEMESMVRNFKSDIVTGNGVLDTILTNKNTYCIRHDIEFTCIADGKLLSFLETLDICSIFGNALDNAIECVEKISNKDKRLIRLNISSKNSFLFICIENYCEYEVDFSQDIPDTTKKDKDYHGYGLKSIQYTAEKYGGTMTLQEKNNWFTMRILIPMQKA